MPADQPPSPPVSTFPRRRHRLRRVLKWGSLAFAAACVLGAAIPFVIGPRDWFVAGPVVAGAIETPGQRFTRFERHLLLGRGMLVYHEMSVYTWVEPFTRPESDKTSHSLAIFTVFENGTLTSRGWLGSMWPPYWQWGRLLQGDTYLVALPLTWPAVAGLGVFLWISRRDRRLSRHGHCLKCGYDTRSVAIERPCPECGGWTRIA